MAYPGSATYRATVVPEAFTPRQTYYSSVVPDVVAGPDAASPLPKEVEVKAPAMEEKKAKEEHKGHKDHKHEDHKKAHKK